MHNGKSKLKIFLFSKFTRSVMVPLISIFLLLILAVIFIVFSLFVEELRSNIYMNKAEQLEHIERNITDRIREVSRITYSISSDNTFFYNPANGFLYSGYSMSKALEKYLISNDFISYLAYHRISELNKFYTSSGEMEYHNFWQGYIQFEGYTEYEFYDSLIQTNSKKVIGNTKSIDNKSYLTIISTLPQFSSHPKAYVISFISDKGLNTIVEPLFADCYGELSIYDGSGELIYRYGNLKDNFSESFLDTRSLLSDERDRFSINIGNNGYMVQKRSSNLDNWDYIAIIKNSDIMSSLNNKQYYFLITLFILLFVAIIATMLCLSIYYSPIYKLAMTVMGYSRTAQDTSSRLDEQKLLSNVFIELVNEKHKIYKELFFTNLLQNQYSDDDISDAADGYDIHFNNPYYSAFTIYLSSEKISEGVKNEIIGLAEECTDIDGVNCHFIFRANLNYILVLVNPVSENLLNDRLIISLEALCGNVHDTYGIKLSIGAGNCYSSMLSLSTSANEAINAMYYCIFMDVGFITRYKDLEVENVSVMVSKCVQRLVQSIRRSNTDEIRNAINELEISCNNLGLTQLHMNYILYSIATALLDCVQDTKSVDELNEIMQSLVRNSFSSNDIFDRILSISVLISERRKSMNNLKKDQLIDNMKEIISERLCDSTLSLETIASDCGVSSSYLSRYFKKYMECTPMSYVENLRMEIVKEKLLNTDLPLKTILEDTGYIDQSSFIRKFKKLEGVTPMAYRKAGGLKPAD